jgi:gamma-glutamyl:cysteine ligase YbdK (ATP-grasp superfamily)
MVRRAPGPDDVRRATPEREFVSVDQSEPIRRSIEVEYWVIDDEGRLADPEPLVDASPGVEREFVEPLLEVKTTPCEASHALRAELLDRLGRVLRRADDLGYGLVPLATPLNEPTVAERDSERTRIQNRVVGDDFAFVRHCAGTHVHVEQHPGAVVEQVNTLIALDPALALVNSAPWFRGEYLAPGARSKLYRWMAYDDLPHQGRLWGYVDDRAAWTRRLERRYEEFVTAAVDAGVDRRAVEANFDPESAVWTPVQVRETFGTVEWRSPDTALPSEVLRLADTVASVVGSLRDTEVEFGGERGRVTDERVVLPEFETVLGHVDTAVREGTADRSLRSYLERMGFDVPAYSPVTHELAGPDTISVEQARRLRLDHADRLARDVRRRRAVSGD